MIPAGVSAILLLAGAVLVCGAIRKKHAAAGMADTAYDTDAVKTGTVLWNGRSYQYNEHLSNFLFLGIDHEELADTSAGAADAGQSDAVFLASWDRVTGDMTLISIPRDTIASYAFYAPGGERIGTVKDHLSLAYAYGDGKHESCRITADAVSELFYGLPIQGYCAVGLEALPVLSRYVGAVTVTVPNDGLESKYPEYQEGTAVVVDEENIEAFVRYRDIGVSQSALLRLERQEAFLKACMEQAKERFREDAGFVTRMYTALEPYMVTNMSADQFAGMAESAAEGKSPEKWRLPGEGGTDADGFDEYLADDEALYEKIIETFYIEAE